MSLQYIFGGSGAGKSTYLYNSIIKESIKNPLENYIIVVPEQYTMATQKRVVELHPRKGVLNIDVVSFERLAYKVFEEVGTSAKLPGITIWFQGVVNAMLKYWPIPTMIIVGIVAGIILYIQTPKGKYRYHYFKYTMPIFGKLIFSLDFSRLMKAMLLNLKNGMRIQEALDVSKNVVSNYVMLSIVENALKNILIGQSWIEPFERSGLASSMITEMLKIGMQTDLSEMMEKLVEYMEIDIDNTMEAIMKTLPQVMYSIVGVVLIFFVVVVVVPMIQVYMGNFFFDAYL